MYTHRHTHTHTHSLSLSLSLTLSVQEDFEEESDDDESDSEDEESDSEEEESEGYDWPMMCGGPGSLGPAWTRGEIERPAGEENMGAWTAAVYTEEQQRRQARSGSGHLWLSKHTMRMRTRTVLLISAAFDSWIPQRRGYGSDA